jgi:hypothetical protein
MRTLVRLLLALVAALGLALVTLAYFAPRWIESPELRERIAAAVRDATGRELHYRKLELGLLPPRLVIDGVALEGGPREQPLGAERIELEVALLPLFARTLLLDTLVVSGAELHLVRTAQGVQLPIRPPKADEGAAQDAAREAEDGRSAGVSVAVREVRIERSQLTLADRTVQPAVLWKLDALDARATGSMRRDAPVAFELTALLGAAPLHAEGELTLAGALDLRFAIADFALAALAPYLPPPLVLAGSADLELELTGELDRFAGPLALELSDAEITRGESFKKPLGERAALTGRLVREGEVFRLEGGELALRDVEIAVSADLAPRLRVALDAAPFALEGFGAWLPALAESGASGSVALERLELATQPLAVHGGIALDRVAAPVGETTGLLSGRLDGRGDALVGENLELRIADQLFRLGLTLDDLAREPRARLGLASEGADAGKLIAGLSGKPATLEGPLALTGDVSAPLGDPDALLRALSGNLELAVSPGRLRGVSLLRGAFDVLGGAGPAAALLGAGKRDRLERFYQDAFETLSGSFQLANGQARTNDLRLVYPAYQVDLRGVLGLLDRSLDFQGRLTLFEDVDEALAAGAGDAAKPVRGVKRALPLAAVTGTLDAPRVSIAPEVALQFAAAYYGGGERREKLERKLDEKLGEGSGKQVFDLLDSVLGGGGPARRGEEQR